MAPHALQQTKSGPGQKRLGTTGLGVLISHFLLGQSTPRCAFAPLELDFPTSLVDTSTRPWLTSSWTVDRDRPSDINQRRQSGKAPRAKTSPPYSTPSRPPTYQRSRVVLSAVFGRLPGSFELPFWSSGLGGPPASAAFYSAERPLVRRPHSNVILQFRMGVHSS